MKKAFWVAMAAGIVGLGLQTGSLWAEDKASAGKGAGAVQCAKGRMAQRLGLTQEQADKMGELRKAQKEAVAPLRKKLKEETARLRELVRDEASDKEIAAVLSRVQETHKAIQAEQEKLKGKLAVLLTPSQQAKMLLAAARMNKAGKGMRMGGRGKGQGGKGGWEGGRGRGGQDGRGNREGRGFGRGQEWGDSKE
ncbi:MAG: Spy/CpxP family protein refolding chaperone [Elusimicrobiota bacterium]|jgi:Spy/CpxP family protein refolding chaperone